MHVHLQHRTNRRLTALTGDRAAGRGGSMTGPDRGSTVPPFPNFAVASKAELVFVLSMLAKCIRSVTAPRKDMLSWLKLARFGNKCTVKDSLRNDANVLAITGIEAEDGKSALERES
jgi:hypothetical protein